MRVLPLFAMVTLAVANGAAGAQPYPVRPIRFVVASGAAGATDAVSRIIGEKLAEYWGQQIVNDNRPGAGGMLAAEIVAHAVPDGYTILVSTAAGIAVSPSLYKKLPYDPERAFTPISMAATADYMLIASPAFAANVATVKELIALARAKPGAISYSHTGVGTGTHLAAELFKSSAGVNLLSVPYKNITAAVIAVMSNEVPISFTSISTALPQLHAGKVKALAVTGEKRSPTLPDLPTVAESGLPGYASSNWYGLLSTAGTPAGIITRFNADMVKALSQKDVRERLSRQGIDANSSSPEQFGRFIKAETAKYARVIKAAGIRSE